MKAIVAMDPNRVVGYKGKIPWYISDDLKFFKQTTMGGDLLMGRNTFESVGPLPGRYTFVLTTHEKSLQLYGHKNYSWVNSSFVKHYATIDDGSKRSSHIKPLWLCGGAKTYSEFLPLCSEIYVSHIIDEYNGDTYMPPFEHLFPNSEVIKEHRDFWVVRYWK